MTWIYWREECKKCVNSNSCGDMKDRTERFKNALFAMEKAVPGVYGTLKFNCDYFILDEKKHKEEADCKGE